MLATLCWGVAIAAFWVGVVALVIYVFNRLMNKKIVEINETNYHDKVQKTEVSASGNAAVAVGNSKIDQSTNINNSGQMGHSISEIKSLLINSDLEERDKDYANLLLDNIEQESDKNQPDKNKLTEYFEKLASIVKSSATISKSGLDLSLIHISEPTRPY